MSLISACKKVGDKMKGAGYAARKQMRESTSGQEALLGHFQVQCLWKALTSELVVCSFLLAP